MTRPPILFFHSVDDNNRNAQSNNTKEILSRWDAEDCPAAALYFHEPDPRVAANANVRLIKLPPNRLWKIRAMMAGLGSYSGVVYPGLAAPLDNRVRRIRNILGLDGAVITTLEGLPAGSNEIEARNLRLGEIAGHRVYSQPVSPASYAALDDLKKHADLIISISPFLAHMASYLWPEPQLASIPLGVDLGIFHSRGRVPHGSNAKVRIICAGNFHATKRPEFFLNLAERFPEAEFTWFGEGVMRQALIEQAKGKALTNLSFPGLASPHDLAQAFRASDVFAMPSISEGVPKVTQEAAACGLPIVCMNYFEPLSVVDGVNGFQATDDSEFRERVASLIDNVNLRNQMGAAAAAMAENWDWDQLAKRWQEQICATARKSSRKGWN